MKRTRIQNDKMFMLQNEVYADSVYPFLKKELKRKVDLFGKVALNGGIYCQNLEVDAEDIFVQKSVFVEEDIHIKGKKEGVLWFNSPVNSEQSILVDEKSSLRTRFGKTIRSKTINLKNSIVYGNIIANELILSNSVVLGGVFTSGKLHVDNSIIGTYHCNKLEQHNNMAMLYPLAISDSKPEITENIFMLIPDASNGKNSGNLYKLGKEDFYPISKNGKSQYIFSSTMRVFDLRAYYLNLLENIKSLFDTTAKNMDELEKQKQKCEGFESRYFKYISSNFELDKQKTWSDYMGLEDMVIGQYIKKGNSWIGQHVEQQLITE